MQLSIFNIEVAIPIDRRLIISLYDYTTAWPQQYIKAGYPVICWDLKWEGDILNRFGTFQILIEEAIAAGYMPYGLLAAPPCTDFTSSGAQWWPEKDKPKSGYEPFTCETELSIALVEIVFLILELYPTIKFWVIENPRGRISKLCPRLQPYKRLRFHPWYYGDPYTKETYLYGSFNPHLKRIPVKPIIYRAGKKKVLGWRLKLAVNLKEQKPCDRPLHPVLPGHFLKQINK